MRFIKKTATGWADSVAEAASLMAAKDIVSLALDTVDDMWFIKATIVEGDKLIFGDPSSSPTSESGKTLLVKETEFDITTSTLHVTGTLGSSAAASKSSRLKKDLLDATPNPTRSISISPESVITLQRDTGFSSNVQQHILVAAQPDLRNEVLAVVVVDKNFANANVRVLAGEETRFNDTSKVDPSLLAAAAGGDQDGNDDGTSLPPSRKVGKADRKPLAESKRKETKLARSAKGQNAPLQESLFGSAIDMLLANLDTEHGEPCPLLIASFGEAAHNFHNFAKAHASAKHDKALLHMANNAIVVDTYGATAQGAAKADSDDDSKPTKPGKKGRKAATPKKSKDSSPSAETNGKSNGSTAKNEDCIWLPAYRQNITKKNMGPFDEMMMRPDVLAKIHNVRYDRDLILVKDISERVRSGESDSRAAYGVKSVEKAIEEGAVGTGGVLLVNKSLFHNGKFQESVASLSTKVREEGGEVRILSDSHDCGQQLSKLGGIAAELTFPVFGLDELEDEEKNGNK
ncbi:Translation factor pelota [Sporothrix stenoceras]|uniref:Translation factor pelota n=1 Tax=Sporothrix stenoceras TaxID=5173 RepID=A0ABR3ZGI3_9PEZI